MQVSLDCCLDHNIVMGFRASATRWSDLKCGISVAPQSGAERTVGTGRWRASRAGRGSWNKSAAGRFYAAKGHVRAKRTLDPGDGLPGRESGPTL